MSELTRNSRIGDKVFWKTVDGKKHEGILLEWDSNVAIIDSEEKVTPFAVEC